MIPTKKLLFLSLSFPSHKILSSLIPPLVCLFCYHKVEATWLVCSHSPSAGGFGWPRNRNTLAYARVDLYTILDSHLARYITSLVCSHLVTWKLTVYQLKTLFLTHSLTHLTSLFLFQPYSCTNQTELNYT